MPSSLRIFLISPVVGSLWLLGWAASGAEVAVDMAIARTQRVATRLIRWAEQP